MIALADVGSNSVRLAVYRTDNQKAELLLDKKYTIGLISYVKDGVLSRQGIITCSEVLNNIKALTESLGVETLLVFATACLRNIDNTSECIEQIRELTGLTIKVIKGEEEAYYDSLCTGEKLGVDNMLVDIGGGSTELIFADGEMLSIPYGSLVTYQLFVSDILGTKEEYQVITDLFLDSLKAVKKRSLKSLVGIGGTMQTLDLMSKRLGLSKDVSGLKALFELLDNDRKKFSDTLLKVSPERIHTFMCGLSILRAICSYFNIEGINVSYSSCREGVLYAYLNNGGIL